MTFCRSRRRQVVEIHCCRLFCWPHNPTAIPPDTESVAEARSVSRLYDRVTRRASPGLDTDLSGLGLSFLYPGNVRCSYNTIE